VPHTEGIKLISALLDVEEGDAGDDDVLIVRGVIDPNSLERLRVDDYQREQLSPTKIEKIKIGIRNRGVPDIVLGMRGEQLQVRPSGMFLYDPVYIIDGLQRVTAAMQKVNRGESVQPRLGALVHINTTEAWERRRFKILNVDRTKLSPNILLRNMRHEFPVMEMFYSLTGERGFVLQGRIQWMQRMRREELISATTFTKVIGRLHSHLGPSTTSSQVDQLANALQRVMEKIGKGVLRDNTKTFFDIIDQAWGVRRVAFKEGATYLHNTFLIALARLFSNHENFWRGNRLMVEASLVRKLAASTAWAAYSMPAATFEGAWASLPKDTAAPPASCRHRSTCSPGHRYRAGSPPRVVFTSSTVPRRAAGAAVMRRTASGRSSTFWSRT